MLRRLVSALLLFASLTAHALDPHELRQLAQAGAPSLALRLLDREQPEPGKDPIGWMQWERVRVALLQSGSRWETLASRLQSLPEKLPDDFVAWARTRHAAALLRLGRAGEARDILRDLIWSGAADGNQLSFWRHLVIQSYLAEDAIGDARMAMVRYQQDYPRIGPEFRLMQARVLLGIGRNADVAKLLEGESSVEGRILRQLARLRAGRSSPASARKVVKPLVEEKNADERQRYQGWCVLAEAAEKAGDYRLQIDALESAVGLRARVPDPGVFDCDADRLWDAWLVYGQRLGNERRLLVGQDQEWLDAAAAIKGVRSRAMLAIVAMKSRADSPSAGVAHQSLAAQLGKRTNGGSALHRLYLASSRFPSPEHVPVGVRYLLVDQALSASNITLASRLMRGLSQPPAEVDALVWHLLRARVLILGGNTAGGIAILGALLAEQQELGEAQLDRLLQVVFDLQAVGDHPQALRLFQQVAQRELSDRMRRELLFWMGDSYKALKDYDTAARRYLDSATLLDTFSMDEWAQTARYQAASTLALAGLQDDARQLYRRLMNATKDPARRAVLQREMEQLWLNSTPNESAHQHLNP